MSSAKKIELTISHAPDISLRYIKEKVDAQKLSIAVLLPAGTRSPKIYHLPEHTDVVLLNIIQTTLNKNPLTPYFSSLADKNS